jgi:hypothetical protein
MNKSPKSEDPKGMECIGEYYTVHLQRDQNSRRRENHRHNIYFIVQYHNCKMTPTILRM